VIVKNQVAGAIERVASNTRSKAALAKKAPPKKASGKRAAHASASR
jgi:hypothetical protein